MTLTARQLRQPPTIEAIERVPYFADVAMAILTKAILVKAYWSIRLIKRAYLAL